MRKWLTYLSVLLLALSCVGQKDDPDDPVLPPEPGPEQPSEEVSSRNLILDFTGTWCVNCPRMETAILEAQAQRPGKIICVSVHCLTLDPLAVMPLSSELAARFGVSAYPSAVTDLEASTLITATSPELLLAQCDRQLTERPQAAEIRLSVVHADGTAEVSIEADTPLAGSYSLQCIVVEDGIIAPQQGGSEAHVHNNVLRSWLESPAYKSAEGNTLEWKCSVPAGPASRIVAVICRDGRFDNAVSE